MRAEHWTRQDIDQDWRDMVPNDSYGPVSDAYSAPTSPRDKRMDAKRLEVAEAASRCWWVNGLRHVDIWGRG